MQHLDLAENGRLVLDHAPDRRKLFDNLAVVAVYQKGCSSRIDRNGCGCESKADCPGNGDGRQHDAPLTANRRKCGIYIDKVSRKAVFIEIGHRQWIVPLQQLSASLF